MRLASFGGVDAEALVGFAVELNRQFLRVWSALVSVAALTEASVLRSGLRVNHAFK